MSEMSTKTAKVSTLTATALGVGAATPVTTQAHIADTTVTGSATDADARTAINAILDVLEAFGLTATS